MPIPESGIVPNTRDTFWILLALRVTEVAVTTGTISRAKLQSNLHHQQTNTQLFTSRMPFLSPNKQHQSTKENSKEMWPITTINVKNL